MKILKILFISALVIFMGSCHKDIDENKTTTIPTPTAKVFDEIQNSIIGFVYDENDQPVENATVKIYSSTTKTDKYGVFSFENVKLDKLGTYIKVEKKGYLTGSDMIYPDKGRSNSYIHLYTLDKTGEFKADKGGTIELEGGSKIRFYPNSIVDDSGAQYDGTVIVTAKKLDIDDKKIGDKMPGALRGIATNGNTAILGTMGMIAVELRDESGNELNLKSGTTANLTMPVDESQLANAPDEIPLWYFDENTGMWIEEGKAIFQDGNYIGDLPHFSWWNLDAKFDPIYMCVKVLFENGKPAAYYRVSLTADVIYPTSYGITDENGQVCGLVPKGKEMILKVINPYCNKVVYKKKIGPFDSDVTLDDIILHNNAFLASGKVECNGESIKNARVILSYDTEDYSSTIIALTDENGYFSFNFPIYNCDFVKSASVFAYNPVTGDASPSQDLDLNNSNNLEINICHNCDFSVEILTNYGSECNPGTISLEAVVTGSGTFTYHWSNGETGNKIDNLENSTYCVTVTETVAQCNAIKCVEVFNYELILSDSIINHPYCGYDNGTFSISASGGVAPYVTNIEGPNGYTFSSVERYFNIDGLEPGTYRITTTDAGGCSKNIETTLIENKYHSIYINASQSCDTVNLTAHVLNSTHIDLIEYKWSDGQTGQSITVNSSGKYCVTATEGSSCAIDTCIDIELETAVSPPNITDCDKNIYKITNTEKYPLILYSQSSIEIQPDETYDFDILTQGFFFEYHYIEAFCGEIQGYEELPHLSNGIRIDSTRNTSCPDCKDGQIYFTINSNNDCNSCEYGNTAIYSIDDLDTDLTSDNNAGTLDTGYYYIVVTDKNTGCFIAHKKVYVDDDDLNKCMIPELSDGIIAYYSFANGSIEDKSGNNYHLLDGSDGQNTPNPTTDRNGNQQCARNFLLGIESSSLISQDSILKDVEAFSISLWYQPLGDRDTNKYENLIKFGDFFSLGLGYCRKAMVTLLNEWRCIDNETYFGCEKAIKNHDWHHLVAIYDGESSISLYRNGIFMDSYSNTEGGFKIFDKLTIGGDFNGKMDDIIIYNKVLTQEEVSKLFGMGTCCD